LRYHLDTSFLVDWQREDPAIKTLVDDILAGTHDVSIDGIIYTEFMAARVIEMRKRLVIGTTLRIGGWLSATTEAARLAAGWLAPMNREQRRAFFADAVIAATAHMHGATILTGDKTAAGVFPVPTHTYR
jgi:predicted nucleic acid-binding protein